LSEVLNYALLVQSVAVLFHSSNSKIAFSFT